jgi:hypothetical protein
VRLVNIRPTRRAAIVVGVVPLLLIVLAYLIASASRHAINPADKILPTPGAMVAAMRALVLVPDQMTGCSGPTPPPACSGLAWGWGFRRSRRCWSAWCSA